ncbi:hypothetical protein, partial [uncultured Desulfovibrio sp.]|uniref:hypothetical protein n=1 Tax=uncultured Desulfovibrio sp. TaxID=167968 RepID=UPI00262C4F0B
MKHPLTFGEIPQTSGAGNNYFFLYGLFRFCSGAKHFRLFPKDKFGSSSFDVELTAPPASLDSPLSGGLPCRLKNFLPWALASRRPG